ncbi:MAG: hypothetical protein ACOCX5_02870 [Chloroflexota bacterium]
MSIEGLLASTLITAVVLIWLAAPFISESDRTAEQTAQTIVKRQQERIQVYYERVLRNLHDIDEDYATGKLDANTYRFEREQWVQRGIQALKALEQLDMEHLVAPASADEAAIDAAIDQAIEAAVTDYRRNPTSVS